MTKEERVASFLAGYDELVSQYGLVVDSCGCCDSPWLLDIEGEDREEQRREAVKHLMDEPVTEGGGLPS